MTAFCRFKNMKVCCASHGIEQRAREAERLRTPSFDGPIWTVPAPNSNLVVLVLLILVHLSFLFHLLFGLCMPHHHSL
jgi:hypothetical protein